MIDLKFLIALAMVVAGLAFAALLRFVFEDRTDNARPDQSDIDECGSAEEIGPTVQNNESSDERTKR